MYKVLIVDDEPMIREGLAGLIPWEEYGITKVVTAENGYEAIKKYEEILPDLMIVDIKMPGMNGIELIEKIREIDSSIHFIILSGYADFDYARNAIRFGVESYLLKPIVEEELMDLLGKLKTIWEHEQKINNRLEEDNLEKMIGNLLTGNPVEKGMSDFFEKLGWSHYRILLFSFHGNVDFSSSKDKIAAYFKQKYHSVSCSFRQDLVVILKNELTIQWNDLYKDLNHSIFQNSTPYTISLSDSVAAIEELTDAYQTAKDLLDNKFFYEKEQILTSETLPFYPIEGIYNGKESSWQAEVEKLLYVIELGDQQGVTDICQEIAKQWARENQSEELIKKNFIHLASLLVNKFSSQKNSEVFSNLMGKVMEIEKQATIRQLINHIREIFLELLENINTKNPDLIVKKMIHLIEQHYSSNIKLDTIAEILHYHRGYLGKLFKEYTGEYFNTYLDKERIKKSKSLLLQELKIYQVAEKVGYANVDYFHSKFKKYSGISPSEYRKQKLVKK